MRVVFREGGEGEDVVDGAGRVEGGERAGGVGWVRAAEGWGHGLEGGWDVGVGSSNVLDGMFVIQGGVLVIQGLVRFPSASGGG